MINKKTLSWSAVAVLVLILLANAALRALSAGQTEFSFGTTALASLLTVLALPVMVYNHFTHANEGPINLMQILLLLVSSILWGFVIERITHSVKRRNRTEH
jgi:hypothetical protein